MEDELSIDQFSEAEWEPGEDASVPIQEQHQDLSALQRIGLKTFADAGAETMLANLKKMGFDAVHRGGMRFSVRKPGEKEWRVIDPSGFELLDDLTDVLPTWLATVLGWLRLVLWVRSRVRL